MKGEWAERKAALRTTHFILHSYLKPSLPVRRIIPWRDS